MFENLFTIDTVFLAIIFAISISLHEFAHAYSSHLLWDPTPKMQGRLTPDPRKHIDPIGFFLIFLIGFGRGRAVQINPIYYKHPYRDELLVALAGPATNIILGIIAILVLALYVSLGGAGTTELIQQWDLVLVFRTKFAFINFGLAAFNMIPLPPLDGYRLIKVLNHQAGYRLEKNVMRISIVFLVFIIYWPFSELLSTYLSGAAGLLFRLFSLPVAELFF